MPLTYSLSPGGTSYSLVYNSCVAGHAEIPSIYNGLPVTSIGPGAFYACQNLTSVTIPNSITHIGDSAFYFTNLNEINVPESITNLPYEFCLSCRNLTGVSLPNSLTGIGASAFGATALTNITIPQNVTNIGSSAFGGTPLNNIYFLGNMPNFSNDIFLNVNSNLKINRIPGKNWNTYFIQGRPVELFYPKDYIIKNQIKSGGNGKTIIRGDKDAKDYIRRVEIADDQFLESLTRNAITDFVIGCKNDGTWDAIKSSCILAGARTLAGALVPLKGSAPTNFNFISSDYNRATGLKGDGSSKYLNSNRNHNSDPQNNFHLSVYVSEFNPSTSRETLIGYTDNFSATSMLQNFTLAGGFYLTNRTLSITLVINPATITYPQFLGTSRDDSLNYSYFVNNTNNIIASNAALSSAVARPTIIFARNQSNSSTIYQFSRPRMGFYSIGENVNLSLLNNRVATLMNIYSTLT